MIKVWYQGDLQFIELLPYVLSIKYIVYYNKHITQKQSNELLVYESEWIIFNFPTQQSEYWSINRALTQFINWMIVRWGLFTSDNTGRLFLSMVIIIWTETSYGIFMVGEIIFFQSIGRIIICFGFSVTKDPSRLNCIDYISSICVKMSANKQSNLTAIDATNYFIYQFLLQFWKLYYHKESMHKQVFIYTKRQISIEHRKI